jgi:hypothetical protein
LQKPIDKLGKMLYNVSIKNGSQRYSHISVSLSTLIRLPLGRLRLGIIIT